ncbi:MAG: sugar ABC transporter permease YjfF [Verrucomicrobia bacterium]|nr:sugar ABC transporter permease YjfF [Verrucomicrobiota bacterium]
MKKLRLSPQTIPMVASVAVLIVLYVGGCLAFDNFGSLRVLINLFGDNAFLGVAAIGITFVILSGGIDLSVGAVVALTSILIAGLIGHGLHPLAAIAVSLAFGAAFGALMGTLIQVFELPPFLVTLGGMFLARGLGFVVHPESLSIDHPFYGDFVSQTLSLPVTRKLSIPFTAVCLVAVVIGATMLARWSRFGRNVRAIGSSEASARLMGVPIARTKILVYTLAGALSALGGVVATFYMQSGNPASFVGLELDAIAAAVIGGTLLRGGVGFIPGTLVGVLILGVIQTLIIFQGTLNSWWTRIAVGGLLFVFILLQQLITRRKK